jgi:hypothetical protein
VAATVAAIAKWPLNLMKMGPKNKTFLTGGIVVEGCRRIEHVNDAANEQISKASRTSPAKGRPASGQQYCRPVHESFTSLVLQLRLAGTGLF